VLDDFNDYYDPRLKRENWRQVSRLGGERARLHEFNFCDGWATENLFREVKFDQVFHLAARAGVRHSLLEPKIYVDTNVHGTLNLLDCARRFGRPKFVFGSSSSVYGLNTKVPFCESDPVLLPAAPYAATKIGAEAMCHAYHHLYGMEVIIARFFNVYGPRQRPDTAIRIFTQAMLRDEPIQLFGDGTLRRDYTYVDDIVDGLMAIGERQFGFEIFNLGDCRTISINDLIAIIEGALGKKARVERKPPQAGDVPITYADITKSRRLLGYEPRVPIEDGVRRFVDWFRNERNP
jgi:UDP-glucuronate 4-epimerase